MKNIVNNVVYFSLESFDKLGLTNGYSTRIGGISGGDFESMNLSLSSGDSRENVLVNLELFAETVGFDPQNTVLTYQTHTANIRKATLEDKGKGFYRVRDYRDIDALVTNEKNVVLTSYSADCCTIYFYDKKHHAIGLAHSGWSGTIKRMAEAVVKQMADEYGTMPNDLICGLAPSILQCCFEVESDVMKSFADEFDYIQEYTQENNSKYLIDLQGINKRMLVDCGVLPEDIECMKVCTKCEHKLFYSHRRDGSIRGSMAAFLSL